MKVFIESNVLTWQKKGGVSRYVVELLKGLKSKVNISNITLFSRNIFYKKHKRGFIIPLRSRLAIRVNKFLIKRAIIKGEFDVLHIPSLEDYFIDVIRKDTVVVITIHNLISEHYPKEFGLDIKSRVANLLQRADRIIAISNQTKTDLFTIYDVPEDKIDVIYHGCSFTEEDVLKNNEPNQFGDYILYVGYRSGYKNFENFCKALPKVLKSFQDLKVVVVGGRKFAAYEKDIIKKASLAKNIIHLENVSEDKLITLYKHAKTFVFPSKYEGFGLPILEAFICGTPVVCSNIGPFSEVGGVAPLYFDPEKVSDISDAILAVMQSSKLQSEMVQRGYIQLNKFSWEQTINSTLKCYNIARQAASAKVF